MKRSNRSVAKNSNAIISTDPEAVTNVMTVLKLDESLQLIHVDSRFLDAARSFCAQPRLKPYLPQTTHYVAELPNVRPLKRLPALRRRSLITLALVGIDHTWLGLGEITRVRGHQYELGYVITPTHWHRGLGLRLLQGLCQIAEQFLDAQSLIAHTTGSHPAAIPLLNAGGFTWVARVKQPHDSTENQWCDRYERILRPTHKT